MKIFGFILLICLLVQNSFGQERELKKMPKRTDKFVRMQGIRLGMDVTRPFQDFWNKGNRYGTEFSADVELLPNFFPVVETGWEKFEMNHDYVSYSGSGSYTRLGCDYNFLPAEHKMDKDMLYVGLRYGLSLAKQRVSSYSFENYWEQTTGSFPSQNYHSHWLEFVLGMKGEIFENFFMGWSIRGKVMLAQKEFEMPPVYFTPGYGNATNSFNFDFTYSVYYTLPFGQK